MIHKKLTAIILCFLSMILLCGCGQKLDLSVQNHTWEFTIVQSGEDGSIIACSSDKKEEYAQAEVIDIVCEAQDGILTISDNANGEIWKLDYFINLDRGESIIYDISAGETRGHATVGVTERYQESSEYTLIVSISGYAVYFVEKTLELLA